ncbi:GNAT family N-acetyltransferase [Acuticoccus sediminis]|uniref:GNAT family N-acetyltransferase n=1 Tax=Acuticoccus sediminis TaxID=2184697 RepID=UPI001CFE11D0|nr:GNAT family N-acetyltransferase [Acuticoccus sediminis]
MSGVEMRPAERGDIAAIVGLLADDVLGASRETVSDPPLPQYVAAFEAMAANPYDHLIVAVDGGEVVGCAQLTVLSGLSRRGSRRGLIEAVRVASSHRGRGLGETLIRHVMALARSEGCALVQLTSDASRTRAHAFYERLGFKKSHVGMKLEF